MAPDIASADWVHLSGEESVVWHGRPSARTLLPRLLPGALLAALALATAVGIAVVPTDLPEWAPLAALPVAALGLAMVALPYLRWRHTHYVVTSNEVYKRRGLLSTDVVQLRLDRVENTSYAQSALQRLLGYGDVVLSTEGGSAALVLDDVPDPAEVHRALGAQLDGVRTGTQ